MKKTLFFVILVFFGTSSIAQEKLDSLWSLWSQKYLADTTRLKAISEITEAVVRNNPDSGYVLA
ncbi:MAG: hypothetical protein E2O86_05845 [Bacteroidetes bacterium]|nr:MAG: hypothetical protein E2O86_05845 [Bacteroidota bacterium]